MNHYNFILNIQQLDSSRVRQSKLGLYFSDRHIIKCNNIIDIQEMSLEASRLIVNPQSHDLSTSTTTLPELGETEVRIQVSHSAITRNDNLQIEGKIQNDYLGVAIVGTILAVGKNVGFRKIGERAGVYFPNVNRGENVTGFASHLQVDSSRVLYIPDTISSEQASALLGDGIAAFNSVEKLPTGSKIAVLGTNNSAFLTVQFAKKVFNHHVTLLSLNSSEGVAEAFGADAADVYSLQTVKKYEEKFDALIITEVVIPELAHPLQSLAMRTGKVFFTNHFCYHNTLVFFDLIVCQREFKGVKRGDYAQNVRMLHAAAYNKIQSHVQVLDSKDYQGAFKKAREENYTRQIVLKY